MNNAILISVINQTPPKVDFIEIEENRIYKLGNKTFWLFFFKYGKWFGLITILLYWFVFSMYFGLAKDYVDQYLESAFYGYLSKELVAMWISMIAFSIIFVGYLRAYVLYRQYKFHLTSNAFHVRPGIFSIKEMVIAYHQIQNVEIHRPYHYRMMGLSKLNISLQNNDSIDLHVKSGGINSLLPVLDKRLASSLAHELVRRGSEFMNNTNSVQRSMTPTPQSEIQELP